MPLWSAFFSFFFFFFHMMEGDTHTSTPPSFPSFLLTEWYKKGNFQLLWKDRREKNKSNQVVSNCSLAWGWAGRTQKQLGEDGQLLSFLVRSPWLFLFGSICLPITFSALLWKHHHSSNPRVWFAFFAESRLTENDRITFPVLLLFWVKVLLPSYYCKAAGTTTRMLHLMIFLSVSRKPWFLLLEAPPHALCMPYHLTPGTEPFRHTGLPWWS